MLIEISKKEYHNGYNFHKNHYWNRKIKIKKNFDFDLLKGATGSNKKKLLFKKNVDNINLETSSYCNRSCGYCPVSQFGRKYVKKINPTLIDNIIKSLKLINYDKGISLNLYNEPLADPNFKTYVKKISTELPKSIIFSNSNGDYIKKLDTLKELESCGLKKLKITLHVPKNIKWNKNYLEKSLEKFSKRINFKLQSKHLKNLKIYFKIGKLLCLVQCPDWFNEGNYRGGSINYNKTLKTRVQPCVKPFREFTIYYDGSITQCCDVYYGKNFEDYKLDKIDEKNTYSIFEIYNSIKLSKIRRSLFAWSEKDSVCSNCSSFDYSNEDDQNLREKILKR